VTFSHYGNSDIYKETIIEKLFVPAQKKKNLKEHLSWIFENDFSCSVEYISKGIKTSCKDLYLKVHCI